MAPVDRERNYVHSAWILLREPIDPAGRAGDNHHLLHHPHAVRYVLKN